MIENGPQKLCFFASAIDRPDGCINGPASGPESASLVVELIVKPVTNGSLIYGQTVSNGASAGNDHDTVLSAEAPIRFV